jgi:hypothetical protein
MKNVSPNNAFSCNFKARRALSALAVVVLGCVACATKDAANQDSEGLVQTSSDGSMSSSAPGNPSMPAAPEGSGSNPAPGVTATGTAAATTGTVGTSTGTTGPVDSAAETNPTGSATATATATASGGGTGGVGAPPVGSAGGDGNGGGGTGPLPTASGGGGETAVTDRVTRTESTYTFEHFPIETAESGVWNGAMTPGTTPTSTTFDTTVIENGYLRVTLLPSYGGRVLSIVHKPTNRELLYQNPLGTPYLMNEDIFYYDYLVILGGIFPSFPEPEHGKYWNLPYAFEIVSESDEAITVRMSRQDDLDLATGVPSKYDVGRTDLLVQVDVTLRAGSSSLEMDTSLTNTRDTALPAFEFWMVNTLAPGSKPGETAIGLNTRIMADMDQVHCLESSWAWFGDAEERVNEEVFRWNNLSHFSNWVDQGTAFANPKYEANWWGLMNEDNDTATVRVSPNVQTPGLKLWTFGKQSLDIDINDSEEWLRPTIEMWYGATPEFWARGSMTANEVRQWSDSYFATFGLPEITAASEFGAVYLSQSADGADTVLSAAASLTLPDQTVKAILRLGDTVISEQDVVVAADDATTVTATVASSDLAPGALFEAEFVQDDNSLLKGQLTLP